MFWSKNVLPFASGHILYIWPFNKKSKKTVALTIVENVQAESGKGLGNQDDVWAGGFNSLQDMYSVHRASCSLALIALLLLPAFFPCSLQQFQTLQSWVLTHRENNVRMSYIMRATPGFFKHISGHIGRSWCVCCNPGVWCPYHRIWEESGTDTASGGGWDWWTRAPLSDGSISLSKPFFAANRSCDGFLSESNLTGYWWSIHSPPLQKALSVKPFLQQFCY